MPTIYADCPRCGFKNREFEVRSSNDITPPVDLDQLEEMDYYYSIYELFAVCGECKNATVFIINEKYNEEHDAVMRCAPPMDIKKSLNNYFDISGFVQLRDNFTHPSPEFVPENIEKTFREGAACLSIECWNAAGGMFRKCLELTAKDKLEKKDRGKKLSTKVKCLLAEKILSEDLKKVATYIILDGNDGLHNSMLTKDDAEDLLGFTSILLGRVYTEPERIRQIEERREERKVKEKRRAEKLTNH